MLSFFKIHWHTTLLSRSARPKDYSCFRFQSVLKETGSSWAPHCSILPISLFLPLNPNFPLLILISNSILPLGLNVNFHGHTHSNKLNYSCEYFDCRVLRNDSGGKWHCSKLWQELAEFTTLTHCGRVTQICVFTLQLCRTGDTDLRF